MKPSRLMFGRNTFLAPPSVFLSFIVTLAWYFKPLLESVADVTLDVRALRSVIPADSWVKSMRGSRNGCHARLRRLRCFFARIKFTLSPNRDGQSIQTELVVCVSWACNVETEFVLPHVLGYVSAKPAGV